MTSESEIEKEIQEKKLNAPRLHPEDIDKVIKGIEYHQVRCLNNMLTMCNIALTNGFVVTGINHGATFAEKFDGQLARRDSLEKARDQIWQLEEYLLAQKLYETAHYAKKIV